MSEQNIMQPKGEEFDVKALIQKYLRYWYLFLIGVFICMAIAWTYLRYSTPQYEVNSTLLIKDGKGGSAFDGSAAFGDLGIFQSSKNIQNACYA